MKLLLATLLFAISYAQTDHEVSVGALPVDETGRVAIDCDRDCTAVKSGAFKKVCFLGDAEMSTMVLLMLPSSGEDGKGADFASRKQSLEKEQERLQNIARAGIRTVAPAGDVNPDGEAVFRMKFKLSGNSKPLLIEGRVARSRRNASNESRLSTRPKQ